MGAVRLGEAALEHTRAGRLDAAVSAYRAALAATPRRPEAHLGLANELVRLGAADRVRRAGTPITVPGAGLAAPAPSILFEDWVQGADGRWEPVEVVAEPTAAVTDVVALRAEARRHYERAIAGGLAAAGEVGLAILAREDGRPEDAGHHLAAARRLGASALPPIVTDSLRAPSPPRP
jgi:hypothetical protein